MFVFDKNHLNENQIKSINKRGYFNSRHYSRVLPKAHHDYRKSVSLNTNLSGKDVAILASFQSVTVKKKENLRIVTAKVQEYATGKFVTINWIGFQYYEMTKDIPVNTPVIIGGVLQYSYEYDSYSMMNPFVFSTEIEKNLALIPEYGTMKYFEAQEILNLHEKSIKEEDYEFIPKYIRDDYIIMDQQEMKENLMHPKSDIAYRKAAYRITIEHLLYHANKMERNARKYPKGSPFQIRTIKNTVDMINHLPYELTGDQKGAVAAMKEKMQEGRRINALVQGDVGCGKTMIAFLAMMMMADNGYQSVLMAPTHVLARQHYEELTKYVAGYGYQVAFLGGKQKAAEKKKILKGIKDGTYLFVVGTHGVFSKSVEYHNLAMAITDEEHRFGVLQREAVSEKISHGIHTITMSATPIPRTVAETLYGDTMDVYTIKEKPAGRQEIQTTIFSKTSGIFQFIEKQIKEGHQAYVVCPLIEKAEEGSTMEKVMSVEETYSLYENYYAEKGIRVGCITGKTKEEQAQKILSDFYNGKYDILIATTIIEVGVNVPNANVIVINNAERFGLAALHQLRGRVGRGSAQSYCILNSECIENGDIKGRTRLKALCESNDGYEIALADLRNRGTGDITGTEQSGNNLYIDLMLEHKKLYENLRKEAAKMCDNGTDEEYIRHYEEVYDIFEE